MIPCFLADVSEFFMDEIIKRRIINGIAKLRSPIHQLRFPMKSMKLIQFCFPLFVDCP